MFIFRLVRNHSTKSPANGAALGGNIQTYDKKDVINDFMNSLLSTVFVYASGYGEWVNLTIVTLGSILLFLFLLTYASLDKSVCQML